MAITASFWVPFESSVNRLTKGQAPDAIGAFLFEEQRPWNNKAPGESAPPADMHLAAFYVLIQRRTKTAVRAGLVRSDRKIELRLKNRRPQNRNEFEPYRSREFPKQAYWGLRKSPFGLVKHAFELKGRGG